jgi:hypothetical protein
LKVISQQRLKALYRYDPETGIFTRVVSRGGMAAGTVAGRTTKQGYVEISIDSCRYQAHRLAWFYMTGCHPTHLIDHINMDPSDNRFANLREATHSQNKANTLPHRDNTTGFKGVSRWKNGRYQANIRVGLKQKHIGTFDTAEEAAAAYAASAREHYGEFARVS